MRNGRITTVAALLVGVAVSLAIWLGVSRANGSAAASAYDRAARAQIVVCRESVLLGSAVTGDPGRLGIDMLLPTLNSEGAYARDLEARRVIQQSFKMLIVDYTAFGRLSATERSRIFVGAHRAAYGNNELAVMEVRDQYGQPTGDYYLRGGEVVWR